MTQTAVRAGLSPVDPPAELPLRASGEIQGNILAGFSKDHQTFVFLQFPDLASARAYLSELTPRIATTSQVETFNAQFSNARRLNGGDDPEHLKAVWVNLGLTHHGLVLLAPTLEADLQAFSAFQQGPVARTQILRDTGLSDPSRWVFGGPGQATIDAILTVAADDPDDLISELAKQRALAAKHTLTVVFEQRGDTLPGVAKGHEHFGFKDGISQPGIKEFHPTNPAQPDERLGHPGTEMLAAGEFILGLPNETGTPAPAPDWMHNGSFQVFRRLRQDVPGWWAQVTKQTLSLPSDDPMREDLLAAKLVGRWRSGTPLAHAPDRDNRSAQDQQDDNDFDYLDDEHGLKTPRFAHIRKMYPRDDQRFGDDRRRIIRRGIPFGETFDPTGGRGHGVDADRGLLFNVFMASIEDQFEFLQQSWANFSGFPGVVFGDNTIDGPDPVIGEDPATVTIQREGRPDVALDFRRFVQTSGALYAFAPSLTTLGRLASGDFDQSSDILRIGGTAFVKRAGGLSLRLRSQPGLAQNTVIGLLKPGTKLTLLEGPHPADGHQWWRVRVSAKQEGWVAGENLVPKLD
jgi:Dyp-type peroxidase family